MTVEDVSLRAEMTNGEIVEGETGIVRHRATIRRLALARQVRPCPEALRALINADAVVVGPGNLYTSVLPNLQSSTVLRRRSPRRCAACASRSRIS